jgi:hypothetical protein
LTTLRIINAVFWLYLALSQALLPVSGTADFWTEKAKQLTRLNPYILDDPGRFAGNLIIPIALWFLIDLAFRRRSKATVNSNDLGTP